MKNYGFNEINHLKIHGRTTAERCPLTLFWTASGIELNVSGSELGLDVETDYDHYEQWISVWINGVQVSRMMLPKGRHWLTLFRGMNAANVRNVKVMKEVQAMPADESAMLRLNGARSDGRFEPVPDRPCRLEFIGDSITSGEGAIGARQETDWIPMWFNAGGSYTKLTADALGADYRVLSQSGWGVMTGWNNDPRCNLPTYYEQVCGLLAGERSKAHGARDEHDFASWQPHVVIVNLGTNDHSAFHQPEWRDEETGATAKQRLGEDGGFHPEDEARLEEAVRDFLRKLRRCNPDAYLLWAYGMLGAQLMPTLQRAMDRYRLETGDWKAGLFQLPAMADESVGARWHPGQLAHARAAESLAAFIRTLLPERAS